MKLSLKVAIVMSGRSQREIASACGIPENRFSGIVRGWTEPRDAERNAISGALGKPVDELFGELAHAS